MSPKIGTHSGTFHCDEAFGVFLLQRLERFAGAEVVRSRDPAVLDTCDVVLDVGGAYDPERLRFDHHQRGFAETFGHGFTTKLSSAGLVYKHFGLEIVTQASGLEPGSEEARAIYLAIYRSFVESLDAIDNGVDQFESDKPPRYALNSHLPARVGRLNPDWNDPDQSAERLYELFLRASELTGAEFLESVEHHAKVWLPGRAHVVDALDRADREAAAGGHDTPALSRVVELRHFCPWKEHLHTLEVERDQPGRFLYVLYEDEREKKWRIQAVSETPGSFVSRKPLPAPWRGLRDEELSKVAGVEGCVFVHASGFIGGASTLEGVRQMARLAIESAE